MSTDYGAIPAVAPSECSLCGDKFIGRRACLHGPLPLTSEDLRITTPKCFWRKPEVRVGDTQPAKDKKP